MDFPRRNLPMTHLDVKIEALKLISPEWRGDFVTFIETGEASPEFLFYLGQSVVAQQACEMVLRGDRLLSEALRGNP
jgi:hypothetical protein